MQSELKFWNLRIHHTIQNTLVNTLKIKNMNHWNRSRGKIRDNQDQGCDEVIQFMRSVVQTESQRLF